MRSKIQFECQTCYRMFNTEDDAIQCHPVQQVYVCDHCGMAFSGLEEANSCGTEEVGYRREKQKYFEDMD